MKKRVRSPYGLRELPTAFWLSPQGMVVPVNLHPELLMLVPKMFGLKRAPQGKAEVEAAMAFVIGRGWARARVFAGGIADFQIQYPDWASLREIADLLHFHNDGVQSVRVRTVEPWKTWPEIPLKEFLEAKFPSSWYANPKRRAGRRRR